MKPFLILPAFIALTACADCRPVAISDAGKLHVVAAPEPAQAADGDNPENAIYRPAQCVGKPIQAHDAAPFLRKGE